eukprot:6489175-Amphidinium_carterae.1
MGSSRSPTSRCGGGTRRTRGACLRFALALALRGTGLGSAQELEEYPGRIKNMTPTQLNTERTAVEAADKAIAHMPGLGDAKRVIAAKLRRLAEEVQHRRPKGEQLSQLDSKHRKAVAAHSKTVANIQKLQADLRAAQQLEKEQASEVQATATRLAALKKELASS